MLALILPQRLRTAELEDRPKNNELRLSLARLSSRLTIAIRRHIKLFAPWHVMSAGGAV
jgi:hypothetical protein